MTVQSLSGRRVYLDANVFIYALNAFPGFASVLGRLFSLIDDGHIDAVTSELTLAEVLVKPMRDGDVSGQQACQAMLSSAKLTLLPITRGILVESARLRAATALKLPDAVHMTTATAAGCGVFLTNDGRFGQVQGAIQVVLLPDLTA